MNDELFNRFESLTFDDVLIVPGYTEVLPRRRMCGPGWPPTSS